MIVHYSSLNTSPYYPLQADYSRLLGSEVSDIRLHNLLIRTKIRK